MNETEAIASCLRGEAAGHVWVMRTYKHLVHTVSIRVLRNGQDAEEATQDSFVKAFQNLRAFQGGSKLGTWLYSIAYRTAISKLRSRRPAEVAPEELPESAFGHHDPQHSVAEDRKRALDKALAELPEEDASVVTLFYLHEQSVDEIVTITGLSASNVKVKLHRSRKRMQATLQHLLNEELWAIREE